MGLPNHKAEVHSSGLQCDIWRTEWTYSDGAGTPSLDTANAEDQAWVDHDPRLDNTTRLTDQGTGITRVKFPKSRRAAVRHLSLEPATPGTASNHRHVTVVGLDASGGTCDVYIVAANGGALSDPESGSRVRLHLDLEYR